MAAMSANRPGLVVAGLAACLLITPTLSAPADKPKLTLKTRPFVPIRPSVGRIEIPVRARLEGELADPEEYYCLTEVWDWGDETQSVHEPDCDPYEKGAEVKRDFSGAHFFARGSYTVTLWLKRDQKAVIDGRTEVRIGRSGQP